MDIDQLNTPLAKVAALALWCWSLNALASPQSLPEAALRPDILATTPVSPATDSGTPEGTPEGTPGSADFTWKNTAVFLGGAATAFLAHESCHVFSNLAMGNVPHLESVKFLKFVPFFTISPGITCWKGQCTKRNGQTFAAGERGLYTIVSAGMDCQNLGNELILSYEPNLRSVHAPFRKGVLAFNVLTSFGYALANILSLEPNAGDLQGMDGLTQTPRGFLAVSVLTCAALDAARYFFPEVTWIPWMSRTSKTMILGVTLSI